jgi:hypothetical protein
MVSFGGSVAPIYAPSLEKSHEFSFKGQLEDLKYYASHPFYRNRVRIKNI